MIQNIYSSCMTFTKMLKLIKASPINSLNWISYSIYLPLMSDLQKQWTRLFYSVTKSSELWHCIRNTRAPLTQTLVQFCNSLRMKVKVLTLGYKSPFITCYLISNTFFNMISFYYEIYLLNYLFIWKSRERVWACVRVCVCVWCTCFYLLVHSQNGLNNKGWASPNQEPETPSRTPTWVNTDEVVFH